MQNKNKYRIKGTNFGYDVPIIIIIIVAFSIYISFTQFEKTKELRSEKTTHELNTSNSKNDLKKSTNDLKVQNNHNEEVEIKDGIYYYSDNMLELTITISGNTWFGKTVIITGMGVDYDNQNTKYESGILKENSLYESSGMIEIGYITGNSLTTSIGGHTVVLRK